MSKWEQYSEMVRTANKTNRSSGAVGPNAVIPKLVRELCTKDQAILDYGAGRLALHAQGLTDQGYNCTAHEFGANVNNLHDPDALSTQHDVVYMSNVLNVQGSTEMLETTLEEVFGALKPGGFLLANYPQSPRKAGLSTKEMTEALSRWGKVERIKGSTPTYKVTKRSYRAA